MNIRKIILLSLSMILVVPGVQSNDEIADSILIGVVSGAVAGCCYGLYKLGNWFFSPSDQQILKKASHKYDGLEARYSPLLSILESAHRRGDTRSINESLLYDLGMAKLQLAYIDPYITQLNKSIGHLKSHYQTLLKRSSSLQYDALHDSTLYHTKREMDALAVRINKLVLRLGFLYEFLRYHKAYFVLFECESDMYGKYDKELNAMQNHSLDYYQKQHIVQRAALDHFSHYPYMYYTQMLEQDSQRLDTALYYLSEDYIYRKQAARQLKKYLSDMCEMVMRDARYHQEILMRDQEKRDLELLKMQERQVKALEKQARSTEKKIRILKELNKKQKRSNKVYIVAGAPLEI